MRSLILNSSVIKISNCTPHIVKIQQHYTIMIMFLISEEFPEINLDQQNEINIIIIVPCGGGWFKRIHVCVFLSLSDFLYSWLFCCYVILFLFFFFWMWGNGLFGRSAAKYIIRVIYIKKYMIGLFSKFICRRLFTLKINGNTNKPIYRLKKPKS